MPRRELDTSRAVCDTCGKLYKPGDAVYSVADKFDEDIADRNVLISFRHWNCHVPIEKVLDDFHASAKKAQDAFDALRRKL